MSARYQAFYCEENAWWLCRGDDNPCDGVVFVSNTNRRVAVFEQKMGNPVLWDYHVIALRVRNGVRVFDFDSTLCDDVRVGVPLAHYLHRTFPALRPEYSHYLPVFRWVPSDVLLRCFGSDRRHMVGPDGSFAEPPPPWGSPTELTGVAHNLESFLDMTNTTHGTVFVGTSESAWLLALGVN